MITKAEIFTIQEREAIKDYMDMFEDTNIDGEIITCFKKIDDYINNTSELYKSSLSYQQGVLNQLDIVIQLLEGFEWYDISILKTIKSKLRANIVE